jgi:hypothetical protein
MDSIIAWAVAFMVSWAQPGLSFIKDAVETPDAGRARYEEIARAAVQVAYDPETRPVFGGPRGRAATVALLLSIAYHESGYRRDVDLGIGKLARGSGKDSCLVQIRVGSGRTPQGWTHEDLVKDREKCFRAGLALIRKSFGACRKLDPLDRLSAYTRGRCVANERLSRSRIGRSKQAPRPPIDDAAVLASIPKAEPPILDQRVRQLKHPMGREDTERSPKLCVLCGHSPGFNRLDVPGASPSHHGHLEVSDAPSLYQSVRPVSNIPMHLRSGQSQVRRVRRTNDTQGAPAMSRPNYRLTGAMPRT